MKSWDTSNSEMDHSRFVAANPGRCPGYIQPSLRDWVVSRTFTQDSRPGLLSAVPTGLDLARAVLILAREGWDQSEDDLSAVGAVLTNLRDWVVSRTFTQDSRPALLSAVPTGL